ncbi:MAG: hypothetical protein JNM39_01235 [Bdellovibrionaceae bacterium]|nr:hypothetical protein [Pseudobdellovibrionaceae bacterium]
MRVFWFGMHKILIQTELPRLRSLGFEVFCPPCHNRNAEHQSAGNGWTADQPTTLTPEIFKTLSEFDFFEETMTPQIVKILNQFFDCVIVTIDATWLLQVLRNFRGKIVYRTYGHVLNVSKYLFDLGAFRAIVERNNFFYLPHALECGIQDDSWLRERMIVVPYCVTDAVLSNLDRWSPSRSEIMISCPNILNSFFYEHFKYLKKYFSATYFKYYGVQSPSTSDPNLVGTLPYDEVLKSYREAAGFLYTYKNPTVCFLPPVEMMITGGPVLYMAGSLLDRYFGLMAPGRVNSEQEAVSLCERLLSGDSELIASLLETQKAVRARYMPEFVWPIFDRAFLQILSKGYTNSGTRRVLNIVDVKSMQFKCEDEVVLADFKNLPYGLDCGRSVTKARIATRVLEYISERPRIRDGRRFLVVHSKALPFWWGVLDFSLVDFLVVIDKCLSAIPPVKAVVPDRTKPLWYRILNNPAWAFERILARVKKRFSGRKRNFFKYKVFCEKGCSRVITFTDRQNREALRSGLGSTLQR